MATILVVDDEERIRNIYRVLLEREGYNVVLSSNIIDARTFMKAIHIDLMLLDINMGELSGDILYEVTQCFHRGVRIIVASVYPVEDQRMLMPDAIDHFDKSEGNKILLEKVRNVLDKGRPVLVNKNI